MESTVTKTILRVRRVRRTTLLGVTAPCGACGRDVAAVTPETAARLLRSDGEELARLVAENQVHTIATVSGASWICRDSIFGRTS